MWTQIITVLVLRFQKLSSITFLNGADLFSEWPTSKNSDLSIYAISVEGQK